jgi:hypothetical protein
MQKAILLRVSLVERHANLYCSRRDTVDFCAERGHERLAPEAFSNFALKWFHNASRGVFQDLGRQRDGCASGIARPAMDRHIFATSEWLVIPFTKTITDFAPAFRSFAISK